MMAALQFLQLFSPFDVLLPLELFSVEDVRGAARAAWLRRSIASFVVHDAIELARLFFLVEVVEVRDDDRNRKCYC